MVRIRVTGMATAGVPPPDMTLQVYLDGVLFQTASYPGVPLNTPRDLLVEVTTLGDHAAYAVMTLANIAGIVRLTSNTVTFTIRPLVRVHVNRMSYERRHLTAIIHKLRVTQMPGAVLYNPTYGYAYDYILDWNIEVRDAGIAPCFVAFRGAVLSGGCGGSGTYRFTAYEGTQYQGEIVIYTVRIPLLGSEGKTFTAAEETDWWVDYDIEVLDAVDADGLRVAYNTALFDVVYKVGSWKGIWRLPDILNYLDFFAQWYPGNIRLLARFYPQNFPIADATYMVER